MIPRRTLLHAAGAVLSLLLVACGGGGADATGDAGTDPAPGAAALDCERLDYPCAWDQVAPAVIEQSNQLGDELLARLGAGMGTADAVAWLKAQAPLAELQYDGAGIRFRLAGGRAVWVVRPQGMSPRVSATAQRAAPAAAAEAGRKQAQRVIRAGATERSALLLAPYRHVGDHFGAEPIAQGLAAMPEFAGRITLEQNAARTAANVTVADFTRFADFDVIYVATHGVDICHDLETGAMLTPCRIAIDAQVSLNPAVDLVQASRVGVELLKYENESHLALSADFFKAHYPQGLNRKLVYFDACLAADAALMDTLSGSTGVYLGWTGIVDSYRAQSVATTLFKYMAQGLSVKQAMARVGGALKQDDEVELIASPADLRIRDIIEVADATSGAPLEDGGGVDASLRPGDGQADRLNLDVTLLGLQADQLDGLELQVLRGEQLLAGVLLAGRAVAVDAWSQRLNVELPLGTDTTVGEVLELEFRVGLPEGGQSRMHVAPKVNDPAGLPAQWLMTSTYVSHGVGSTTTKVAQVTWELEPDDNPAGRYHYYRVKSGTVSIVYEGDVNSCRVAYETVMSVPAGAVNNSLKFDTGAPQVLLDAFGQLPSQPFQASGICEDGSTLDYPTTVGGPYLYADDQVVEGSGSISGGYNSGAQLPTVVEYLFTPVR